jgi:transposase
MKTKKQNIVKQVIAKVLDFTNQTIFVGIDVHKKSWKVTIYFQGMELQTFSMDPNPGGLVKHLRQNYPNATYISVYEAGFCGYWIDRELQRSGIKNIVVNPADVPTKNKERTKKTDKIDSRKLSRELSSGTLEGIYIPTEEEESIRTLSRLRQQLVKDQTRIKNRIKSLLNFVGVIIPENHVLKHWSSKYIKHLEGLEFNYPGTKYTLNGLLVNLKQLRMQLVNITKTLRSIVKEDKRLGELTERLRSVPGIGIITAITLYTEILRITRFGRFDKICSYVGFVPSTASSGEKEKNLGLSRQHNKYLRNMIIESAWVAVRKDPALTMAFGNLSKRMSKQEAIIRIAKKLLSRIMYVWKNEKEYVCAVVG